MLNKILFNNEKCRILHLGRKKTNTKVLDRQYLLGSSTCNKNLNVQIKQVVAAARAILILDIINTGTILRSWEVVVLFYVALVRPQLEYDVQF